MTNENNSVWVVEEVVEWEGSFFCDIFSTKEVAEKYVSELKLERWPHHGEWSIEEEIVRDKLSSRPLFTIGNIVYFYSITEAEEYRKEMFKEKITKMCWPELVNEFGCLLYIIKIEYEEYDE